MSSLRSSIKKKEIESLLGSDHLSLAEILREKKKDFKAVNEAKEPSAKRTKTVIIEDNAFSANQIERKTVKS